mgnify:CR=1 FL=1
MSIRMDSNNPASKSDFSIHPARLATALMRKVLGSSDFPLLTRRLLVVFPTGFFPDAEQVFPVVEQVIPVVQETIPVIARR